MLEKKYPVYGQGLDSEDSSLKFRAKMAIDRFSNAKSNTEGTDNHGVALTIHEEIESKLNIDELDEKEI